MSSTVGQRFVVTFTWADSNFVNPEDADSQICHNTPEVVTKSVPFEHVLDFKILDNRLEFKMLNGTADYKWHFAYKKEIHYVFKEFEKAFYAYLDSDENTIDATKIEK